MGRASDLNMTKYGVLEGVLVVPRYSPPGPPQSSTTPGTPPLPHLGTPWHVTVPRGHVPAKNSAVGLKSVAQLTLSTLFSDIRGITEVYNLLEIHNR